MPRYLTYLIKFTIYFASFLLFLRPIETEAKNYFPTENIQNMNVDAFVVTPFVQRQAQFWEKIFYIFPSNIVVFHDAEDPDIIIKIVDLDAVNLTKDPEPFQNAKSQRDRKILLILKDLQQAANRLKNNLSHFIAESDSEERVSAIYLKNNANRNRIINNHVRFRAQSGLADKFLNAARVARSLLPTMEDIFGSYGLPRSLTRMAFVESMFNIEARSKVGASGIWQFMPATARLFLFVNDAIDERNSPIKSTKAAAQLLLKNFMILKSWPHAITAYNHGVNGMQQAILSVRSLNFDRTILQYESPSFGFASKNFYAEFIAARRIFNRYYSQIEPISSDKFTTSSVILTQPLNLQEIATLAELPIDDILTFNPCILPNKDTKSITKRILPRYFELFAPEDNIFKFVNNLKIKDHKTSAL